MKTEMWVYALTKKHIICITIFESKNINSSTLFRLRTKACYNDYLVRIKLILLLKVPAPVIHRFNLYINCNNIKAVVGEMFMLNFVKVLSHY